MMSKHGGEKGEKEKQSGSCAVEKSGTGGEEQDDGSGLRCHLRPCDVCACAATEGHV